MQTASQQQMKRTNMKTVFRLIQSNQGMTRAYLSKLTRLSPSTISSLVEELIAKGIVIETAPAESSGVGRKAISLDLDNSRKFVIGMEVNAMGVNGTLFNLKHEPIITVTRHALEKRMEPKEWIKLISDSALTLAESLRDREMQLLGVCIGIPAVLDRGKKSIMASTPLQVENMELYQKLTELIPYALFIENETFLAAIAEREMFDSTMEPFIYLSINSGLGACVMMHKNKTLQGANGVLLEIGHMSLDIEGRPCACGNRGCFELMASVHTLIEKTKEGLSAYPDSVIPVLSDGDLRRLDETHIAQAVRLQDPLALKVTEEIADNLGKGIVNLVNIFNPNVIVIGGRLAVLGEPLLSRVKEKVQERALKPFLTSCEIVLSRHKQNSVSKGASVYALNRLIDAQI